MPFFVTKYIKNEKPCTIHHTLETHDTIPSFLGRYFIAFLNKLCIFFRNLHLLFRHVGLADRLNP